jgi:hypothetical protein
MLIESVVCGSKGMSSNPTEENTKIQNNVGWHYAV